MTRGSYLAARPHAPRDLLGAPEPPDPVALELKLLDLAKLVRTAQECQQQSDVLRGLQNQQLAAGLQVLHAQLQQLQAAVFTSPDITSPAGQVEQAVASARVDVRAAESGRGTGPTTASLLPSQNSAPSLLQLAKRTELATLEARISALEADVQRRSEEAQRAEEVRDKSARELRERVAALEGSVSGGRAVRSAWAEQADIAWLKERVEGLAAQLARLGLEQDAAEDALPPPLPPLPPGALGLPHAHGSSGDAGRAGVEGGGADALGRRARGSGGGGGVGEEANAAAAASEGAGRPGALALPERLQAALDRSASAAVEAAVGAWEARAAAQRATDMGRLQAVLELLQALGTAQQAMAAPLERLAALCPRLTDALHVLCAEQPPSAAPHVTVPTAMAAAAVQPRGGWGQAAGRGSAANAVQLQEACVLATEAEGLVRGLRTALAGALELGQERPAASSVGAAPTAVRKGNAVPMPILADVTNTARGPHGSNAAGPKLAPPMPPSTAGPGSAPCPAPPPPSPAAAQRHAAAGAAGPMPVRAEPWQARALPLAAPHVAAADPAALPLAGGCPTGAAATSTCSSAVSVFSLAQLTDPAQGAAAEGPWLPGSGQPAAARAWTAPPPATLGQPDAAAGVAVPRLGSDSAAAAATFPGRTLGLTAQLAEQVGEALRGIEASAALVHAGVSAVAATAAAAVGGSAMQHTAVGDAGGLATGGSGSSRTGSLAANAPPSAAGQRSEQGVPEKRPQPAKVAGAGTGGPSLMRARGSGSASGDRNSSCSASTAAAAGAGARTTPPLSPALSYDSFYSPRSCGSMARHRRARLGAGAARGGVNSSGAKRAGGGAPGGARGRAGDPGSSADSAAQQRGSKGSRRSDDGDGGDSDTWGWLSEDDNESAAVAAAAATAPTRTRGAMGKGAAAAAGRPSSRSIPGGAARGGAAAGPSPAASRLRPPLPPSAAAKLPSTRRAPGAAAAPQRSGGAGGSRSHSTPTPRNNSSASAPSASTPACASPAGSSVLSGGRLRVRPRAGSYG